MFTAEMMAPCGLDCSLCLFAHNKEKPCPGCNAESDAKPEFCTKWCRIIPCEDLEKLEDRYMTAYPLKESPIQNLRDIRSMGLEAFLAREREKWTCAKCGGPICVHNGICRDCGDKAAD